jgi:ankyrin repeat protein
MSHKLPERASLEYLRKRAKTRLRELRAARPDAKLTQVHFEIARELGFSSWRALKEHVERERTASSGPFFKACDAGALDEIGRLLDADPSLVHERHTHQGRTALHRASVAGQAEVALLLLQRGADPNARDESDRAYPHHYAAERGDLSVVRACLDHGGDAVGEGDAHELGVIGWAVCIAPEPHAALAKLLLQRGARHHVCSAIALAELGVIEELVEGDARALERRLSRFEHAETPLHFAARRASAEVVELLLQLGADLEAVDDRGRSPLASALLAQNEATVNVLRHAGAKAPERAPAVSFEHATPILPVHDFARAMAHYQQQLGFKKRWAWGEPESFGCVERDDVSLFLSAEDTPRLPRTAVFIDVEEVDALHREYLHSGATIREAPTDQPWGSREMLIEDLEGNRLRLASPNQR